MAGVVREGCKDVGWNLCFKKGGLRLDTTDRERGGAERSRQSEWQEHRLGGSTVGLVSDTQGIVGRQRGWAQGLGTRRVPGTTGMGTLHPLE